MDILEDLHIKQLVTLYPLGLNDHILMSKKLVTQTDLTKLHCNNTFYFCYPTKRNNRSHHKHKYQRHSNHNINISVRRELAFIHATLYINAFYKKLRSFSYNILCKVRSHVLIHKESYANLYVACITAFTSTIMKNTSNNKKKLLYFKVPFIHPIIEYFNIPSMIHNKKSILLLPMTSQLQQYYWTISF